MANPWLPEWGAEAGAIMGVGKWIPFRNSFNDNAF